MTTFRPGIVRLLLLPSLDSGQYCTRLQVSSYVRLNGPYGRGDERFEAERRSDRRFPTAVPPVGDVGLSGRDDDDEGAPFARVLDVDDSLVIVVEVVDPRA